MFLPDDKAEVVVFIEDVVIVDKIVVYVVAVVQTVVVAMNVEVIVEYVVVVVVVFEEGLFRQTPDRTPALVTMATQVSTISASFATLSFTPQTEERQQGHFPAKYAEAAPIQAPSARHKGLL